MKEKLNSWKEIATYLGRDESTARRWEKECGLPIHRIGGAKGASVYAYAAEIDQWHQKSSHFGGSEGSVAESQGAEGEAVKTSEVNENEEMLILPCSTPGPTPQALPENDPKQILRWHQKRISLAFLLAASIPILCIVFTVYYQRELPVQKPPLARSRDKDVLSSDQHLERDATEIKILVKNSQIWEMLTLYSNPWTCDTHDLQQYWETNSKAFLDVVESVSRLEERGWHYGFGAKLLDFQFRYVKIAPDGLSAEVGTREHWWVPLYTRQGVLVSIRNPDQGPYEIDYFLIKANGNWKLRSTTTPYSPWKPERIRCKNWSQ